MRLIILCLSLSLSFSRNLHIYNGNSVEVEQSISNLIELIQTLKLYFLVQETSPISSKTRLVIDIIIKNHYNYQKTNAKINMLVSKSINIKVMLINLTQMNSVGTNCQVSISTSFSLSLQRSITKRHSIKKQFLLLLLLLLFKHIFLLTVSCQWKHSELRATK